MEACESPVEVDVCFQLLEQQVVQLPLSLRLLLLRNRTVITNPTSHPAELKHFQNGLFLDNSERLPRKSLENQLDAEKLLKEAHNYSARSFKQNPFKSTLTKLASFHTLPFSLHAKLHYK